jgi:polysaccharide pyruvyl transferase WcaK-like protein
MGYLGRENLGDDLLLYFARKRILSALPNVQLNYITRPSKKFPEIKANLRKYDVEARELSLFAALREVYSARYVIWIGGSCLDGNSTNSLSRLFVSFLYMLSAMLDRRAKILLLSQGLDHHPKALAKRGLVYALWKIPLYKEARSYRATKPYGQLSGVDPVFSALLHSKFLARRVAKSLQPNISSDINIVIIPSGSGHTGDIGHSILIDALRVFSRNAPPTANITCEILSFHERNDAENFLSSLRNTVCSSDFAPIRSISSYGELGLRGVLRKTLKADFVFSERYHGSILGLMSRGGVFVASVSAKQRSLTDEPGVSSEYRYGLKIYKPIFAESSCVSRTDSASRQLGAHVKSR